MLSGVPGYGIRSYTTPRRFVFRCWFASVIMPRRSVVGAQVYAVGVNGFVFEPDSKEGVRKIKMEFKMKKEG